MSVCPAIVFSNLSAGQFQMFANAFAAEFAIPINGTSGTQSKAGYTITWNFDATKATLTIQCLAYPSNTVLGSFLTPALINGYLLSLAARFGLKGAVGAPAAPGTPALPQVSVMATCLKTVTTPGAPPPPGACNPVVFSNITAGQFQCLAASFTTRYGIQVNGTAGTQSKNGTTITWNFNAAANTLTFQCTAHPFFAPCALINQYVQAMAASLGVK
jgi:hypothetical protein